MELGILGAIAFVLGCGVAGGLLSSWGCHRKLLALELTLKAVFTGYEDRMNELERITTREVKREAANVRWRGSKAADEALVKQLTEAKAGAVDVTHGHPWDPRTWGGSS